MVGHPLPQSWLTAPVPERAYARGRLFSRLDSALRGRVVWISAQAGAGKTTVVASWLAARGCTPLWYQLGRGDEDPAAFFACLTRALGDRTPLPAFTAEYFGGLPVFARNYFRQLFAALPPSQRLLVFDDYHEVDPGSPLHEVMREGLAEVPEGATVLLISRTDPPPPLARLRMRDDFILVGRDELLLSAEEAAGICRLRCGDEPLAEELLARLYQRTRGWAAGLVLLLEQLRGCGTLEADDAPLVFDYLAGEVYARMGADEQALLIKSALLPAFTAEAACRLTGLPHARDLLEALFRRNYFTARHLHGEGPASYEYHPLFRRFLLELGRRELPPAELTGLKRAAAELLAAEGAIDACVGLLREIGDFDLMMRLILQHAPGLLRNGLHRTLEAWLSALPPGAPAGDPWLTYYQGLAALPFDLELARDRFERAFDAFNAADAVEATYLAWAGVVDTYLYAWGGFAPADRWIAELERLRERHGSWPSLAVEVRVTAGIFAILIYRRPDHPQLPAWTDRLEALLLLRDIDPVLRMTAAAHLMLYLSWWQGAIPRAKRLLERLAGYGEGDGAAPLTRISWAAAQAIYFWVSGDTDACTRAAGEGLKVAEQSGVRLWDAMLIAQLIWAEITNGQVAAAEALLCRFEALLHPAQTLHVCQYHFQRLCHAAYLSDHDTTLAHARAALEKALEAGVVWAEGIVRYGKAFAHHLRGEPAERDAELAVTAQLRERTGEVVGEGMLMVRAFAAVDRGEGEEIGRALRELFGLLRRTGLNNCTIGQPARFARLCAEALRHDIEPDYVRQLIRLRRFRPEPGCTDQAWPWPVRIRTLGGFAVELEGRPLTFRGKAQRRPLELLQNLLAHGGRQVPEGRIAAALWPDADGEAAHFAFHTTLQRLRKLLGEAGLLRFREGQLTLDEQSCWVDLWALDRLAEDDAEGWLRLYRGPFLAQALDAAWAIAPRERLRGRFTGVVLARGEALEAAGDFAAAEALYERALRVEEGAGELRRRLAECRARRRPE